MTNNITEPTIRGLVLRPLTSFRWNTITAYVDKYKKPGFDQGVQAVFAYATLATSDTEPKLHGNLELLDEAVIETGITLTEEEATLVGDYINSIINEKNKAKVEVVNTEGK